MIKEPILLVDDEAELRAFLREALEGDGYRLDEAPDANTALALMADRHYAVVLTDLNMPGGPTGFELITAVRAKDPDALCVVITGYASLEVAVQAVKFGAYDFVQKPFKLAEIEAVLDRALDHAAIKAQLRDYQRDLEGRVLARTQELQVVHDEVLRLNDLLVDSLGHATEGPILEAFMAHLGTFLKHDGHLALLPAAGDAWTAGAAAGARVPDPRDLPAPSRLTGYREWTGPGGYPEGHLVPLFSKGALTGALYLGFEARSSFHPDSPAFILWRRQLEAALLGLHRARVLLASGQGGAR